MFFFRISKQNLIKCANMNKQPAIDEWRALYEEAQAFKELAPWQWMSDQDVFGIEHPVTKEVGYCSVMGQNKEHFGLAVYRDSQGLEYYLNVQNGAAEDDPDEMFQTMDCLTASFDSSKYLEADDKKIIKKLGLKFRGAYDWPNFRSYMPGYYPWFLDREEVLFLTLCLKHARDFADKFKDNPDCLGSPLADDQYLVRAFHDPSFESKWTDEKREPKPYRRIVKMVKEFSVEQLERIKTLPQGAGSVWEIGSMTAPARIGGKHERPFIPVCILFMDHESFFIFNMHMAKSRQYRVEFVDQFLNTIEKVGFLPSEIYLKNEELLCYLEPLAKEFLIKLTLVDHCPAIADARSGMRQFLTGGKLGE